MTRIISAAWLDRDPQEALLLAHERRLGALERERLDLLAQVAICRDLAYQAHQRAHEAVRLAVEAAPGWPPARGDLA